MKKGISILLTAGLILFSSTALPAQDFSSLLDAVEKIETNLKAMVEKEAQARSDEMAKLRIELKGLKANGSGDNQADLVALTSELEYLRQEVALWKSFIEQNKAALASLDGGAIPTVDNDAEMNDLKERLETLNETLHDLTSQGKPAHAEKFVAKTKQTSVHGKIFSHGLMDISDGPESYSEFALSRTYVTLRSKLSDNASIRVTSDMKTIDGKYNIILKYVYFDWKPNFSQGYLTARAGLQPTLYIDDMNKFWGRRYVSKTISDEHHFLTSSDLGVSAIVGFGPKKDWGYLNIALLNGTSYSDVQEVNTNKDINIVAQVKPFKNVPVLKKSTFMGQFYSGTQNESLDKLVSVDETMTPWDTTTTAVYASDWKREIVSFGGVFAFKRTFDLAFDMNWSTVGGGPGHDAHKKSGLSFFGTFRLNDLAQNSTFWHSVNFFGRVDLYDPNTSHDLDAETLALFGIEAKPVNGLYLALNYRSTSHEDKSYQSENVLLLNTQFKF